MEKLGVMVGLSECDYERDSRTQILERLWQKLLSNPYYKESFNFLYTSIDLYREAMSCFQNGAYLATAILCRATVEACVHLVLSRSRRIETEYRIQTIYSEYAWGELKNYALKDPILKDKIYKIELIREKGNFAAHLSQRIDKQIIMDIEKNARDMKAIRPIKLWITACEAKDSLEKTVDILGNVIEKVATPLNLENIGKGKGKKVLSSMIQNFKVPSFIMLIILCIIESIIYWFGNPIIYNEFAWHHIPELSAAFFLGMWMKELRFKWWQILMYTNIPVILLTIALRDFGPLILIAIADPLLIFGYSIGKGKSKLKI